MRQTTRRHAAGTVVVCAALLSVVCARPAVGAPAQQDDTAVLVLVSAPASILGVNIRDIDEHAAHLLNLRSTAGVEVIAVDHDAPAGKAGMRLRDVILAVDGKPVTSAAQFRETMRGYPPQRQVVLAVIRDGEPLKFTITLADRAKLQQQAFQGHFNAPMPELRDNFGNIAMQGFISGNAANSGPEESGYDDSDSSFPQSYGMGAELDPIGPQLASFFGVKDGTGMLVKSVEPGSPAAAAGLQAGDVVLKLNEDTVMNPIDWVRCLEASQGKPMQITIVRNKRMQTLTLAALPRTQAMLETPGSIFAWLNP